MQHRNIILSSKDVRMKLNRLALEIAENHLDNKAPLYVIGIKNSGFIIAEYIVELLHNYFPVHLISLEKNENNDMYLGVSVDFNDKHILLIDDVCNSGRTLMYALKPLLHFLPASVHTLVLVERMHKLFPVKPDYVGFSVATTVDDFIKVEMENEDLVAYLTMVR
jgi:pyrimidine operon attenuation protein/uracil phosphoribosyltransferase